MVLVRFFAGLREKVKNNQIEVSLEGEITLQDFIEKLLRIHPELDEVVKSDRATIAVNHEVAEMNRIIKEGDEIAFFPPVSGG